MKRFMVMFLGILATAPAGWAEDAKPAPAVAPAAQATPSKDLADYLDQLQLKLDHAAQRANQPSATGSSVAGLRGAQQEPVSKQLYWKGKATSAPLTPEEVKEFRSAIEQAKAGKTEEATAALKTFLDKHPKSALRHDAEDTLARLVPAPAKP